MPSSAHNQTKQHTLEPIGFSKRLAYTLPVVPGALLITPMAIIQGIYAKHYGLALTTLATILLISRIFDAVTDPLVGYYSDWYRNKKGSRKPLVSVGTVLLLFSSYFLYVPYGEVTALYFGFWSILLYASFTLFEIPHITWPCEITHNLDERAKLYSARVVAIYTGLGLFYSIPLLPIFDTQEITPTTLTSTFAVAAALGVPFLLYCLFSVPNGESQIQTGKHKNKENSLGNILTEVAKNKAFMLVLLAFFFAYFGTGMWYGLIFTYVDAYLGLGKEFAKMFLIAFIVGMAVPPVWCWLAIKLGKKQAWLIASGFLIIAFILTGILTPDNASFAQLLSLKVIQTCAHAGIAVFIPSMLSDCIDYMRWKSHSETKALYFSIKLFIEKASMALGVASGLAIAGWYGIDVTATEHSSQSVQGLKMAIAWVPAALTLISLIFIAVYPLNVRRVNTIKASLDKRELKAALSDVSEHTRLTGE
jgi:Na+/melibiose symporter-like transporter